ncbi:MAG: hypothetical protein N2Z58_02240 [Fervidobacterium sp.]|nr:hypothetical protein [Fervidobacterium sp.]
MGMFTIEIDSGKLKDILKKADKVCGTLEQSNRKISLFSYEGKLYLLASDGCLYGYFDLAPYLFPKTFQPFEIPLDVVKQFSLELNGKVNLLFQDNMITFKCQNEILRLRVNYAGKEICFPKISDLHIRLLRLSRKKFINELDFVSCFLEEGSYTNFFITKDGVEFISHHMGIVSYVRLKSESKLENKDEEFREFSLRIPYVSSRHIIKALDTEQTEELTIYFDGSVLKLHIEAANYYTFCGDLAEESPDRIRNLCRSFEPKLRINSLQLQRLLRRSLILGRFSDVQLYTRSGELVVVSQHGPIAYRGSMEIEINLSFSIKTKAHFLKSALTRIGSQYILVDVIDDYVLLSAPSLSRFLILKNEKIQ